MELSMSTIVVVVLSVTMLILGFVLIRNIACSAVGLTDDISEYAKNEVARLFGERDFGVQCIGAIGGTTPKIADDGVRDIVCVIREDAPTQYRLEVEHIRDSRTGQEPAWVLSRDGWSGTAGVGTQIAGIAVLDIPRNAPATSLEIKVNEYKDGSNEVSRTHMMRIDVVSSGRIARAIC